MKQKSRSRWTEGRKNNKIRVFNMYCETLLPPCPFTSKAAFWDHSLPHTEGRLSLDQDKTTETHKMVTCRFLFCLHHSLVSCIHSSAAAFSHLPGYIKVSAARLWWDVWAQTSWRQNEGTHEWLKVTDRWTKCSLTIRVPMKNLVPQANCPFGPTSAFNSCSKRLVFHYSSFSPDIYCEGLP